MSYGPAFTIKRTDKVWPRKSKYDIAWELFKIKTLPLMTWEKSLYYKFYGAEYYGEDI